METEIEDFEPEQYDSNIETGTSVGDVAKAGKNIYRGYQQANKFLDAAFQKEIASSIKKHGVLAAIIMAVPLWGVETIAYALVLWHMYYTICNKAQVPFFKHFWRNIFSGFISNWIVVFILNLILDFIPVIGWVGAAIIGYFSIYLSGIAFVETLKKLHGKEKVKTTINYSKGWNSINGNN